MSSNRPNLASAFAPSAPRGAKLEGILAPKRRKAPDPPEIPDRSLESTRISVVPELAPESEAESTAPSSEFMSTDPAGAIEGLNRTQAPASKTSQASTSQRKDVSSSSGTKASEVVLGALRNVGVYLAPDLLATVKEALHSQRTTYADLLLDAFDSVSEASIAKEFRPETIPSLSGMPRRVPRRRGEAGIQIQVRLDGHQTAWLDEKVVEFNAPSRSALVSTVYRLYLND
ncbi:hypothetical protein [Paenarthrobacter histidinolovorans]|uniref:hypothetical protein n=1 Tax=Paenarthrobacter histidinolovorans TaxID=43664 RepID=UPI0016668475|nr:hypothetical protein [Paenarthrobacter histidinolovorans]GGJ40049.1 hypothetical protein GCM10010052_41510 [Paenarthrobacter histidinolovorans]